MFNEEDMKTYGYDIVMRPLVDDIKELETNGVHIDSDVFNGTVRVSIAQVSGDNLGVNGICGFVESFVGNYYCRHCKMHSNHMWYSSTERPECLRTKEDYEVDVAVNDPSITGVKPPCILKISVSSM